jgi:hypothetical protein
MVTIEQVQARVKQDRVNLPQRVENPAMQATLHAAYDRLETQFNGFRDQLAKIVVDPRLSPEGQRMKRVELATKWLEELKWLATQVVDATAAVARLRALAFALPPIITKRDPRDQCARDLFIVLRYVDQDQAARDIRFLKAYQAEGGPDVETIQAMLDAPGGSLVSPEMQDRAQRQYAEQTKPDLLHTLEQTKGMLDLLQGPADHVQRWLTGLGVKPAAVAA